MPNQRKPGQTFVGVQLSSELLSLMEDGRKRLHKDRSQFVREAIVEKLQALGFDVPDELKAPADRTKPIKIIPLYHDVQDQQQTQRVAEEPNNPL